jgi:hypothetical protein
MRTFVKRESNFVQLFVTPRIDWCSLMNNKKSLNPITRSAFKSLKIFAPELVHACPYLGSYVLKPVYGKGSIISIFPNGIFRLTVDVSDQSSNEFFLSFLLEVAD